MGFNSAFKWLKAHEMCPIVALSLIVRSTVLSDLVPGSACHRQKRARGGPEPGLRNAAGVWERDAHGLQVPQTVRHLRPAWLQDHGKSLKEINGTHSLLFCRVRCSYQMVIFIELISTYIQYLLSSAADRRDKMQLWSIWTNSLRLPQSSLCSAFPSLPYLWITISPVYFRQLYLPWTQQRPHILHKRDDSI
jgi:hypothetical protein